MAAPIYVPTTSTQVFPFLHILANTCYYCLFDKSHSYRCKNGGLMQVRSLSWEDALEEGMATHSSILAWRIPWIEEPGGLQSMGWQRAGHD